MSAPVVPETTAGMAALPVEVCTTGSTTFGAYGLAVGVGLGDMCVIVFVLWRHAI